MRDARSNARRDIRSLSLLVGGTNFGSAAAIPVLPLHAGALGASVSSIGLAIGAYGLGRLLANLPAGHLADRAPVKPVLVAAGLAAATATGLIAVAGGVGQLLVLRLVAGLATGAAVTVAQTSLILIQPKSSPRAFGYLLSAQFAAGSLGPVVGGLVADAAGTSAAFVVAGAVGLGCSLAAAVGLRSPELRSVTQPARGAVEDREPGIGRRAFVGVCLAGGAVVFARYAGEQVLIPVLAYQEGGVSPRALGFTFGLAGAANVGLVVLSSRLGERVGQRLIVVVSLTTYATLVLGFLLVHEPIPMLGLVLVAGLVTAFSATAPTAYLLERAGGRGGSAIGAFRTVGDLAATVGAFTVGWFIDRASPDAAVLLVAAVLFVVAGAFTALTAALKSDNLL